MTMDVLSRTVLSSTLNPDAPMFVPTAYRMVEDFSDDWWALIHSCPWFRDYWLRECFHDPQTDLSLSLTDDSFFPEGFCDLFEDVATEEEKAKNEKCCLDLVSLKGMKWRKFRSAAGAPRYIQKVPKIVNVKVSPRTIQQPR